MLPIIEDEVEDEVPAEPRFKVELDKLNDDIESIKSEMLEFIKSECIFNTDPY